MVHLGRLFWSAALVALAIPVLAGLPDRGEAATGLSFPGSEGSRWSVAAGYNTATHSVADANDPWALDLVRTDAPTAGSKVLAPTDGRVGYTSDSCLSMTDAQQITILICHVFAEPGLRGKNVKRGQLLATVAPAGQANNNGLAHIHIGLNNSARQPIPFAGSYAIEGIELLPTDMSNWHSGVAFTSTNVAVLGVDAGADMTVNAGATVVLMATASSPTGEAPQFQWTQTGGTTVQVSPNGGNLTFIAPQTGAATLQFSVTASVPSMAPSSDTVSVTVRAATATRTATPARTATATASRTATATASRTATAAPTGTVVALRNGSFASTPVFSTNGQAQVVFAGGTVAEFESAVTGQATVRGAWVQDSSGAFRLLIVGGAAFLRDAFASSFPSGFNGPVAVTLVK